MDHFLKEVEERTHRLARRRKAPPEASGIYRLGLKVPQVRAAIKEGYSFFDEAQPAIVQVWDHIWRNSDCHEVMSQALYFYQGRSLARGELAKIRTWVERCTCWQHSDDLSKIYAQVVEERPERMLPTLRKWNRAKNPWKRRQSVVSLLEYASKRQRVRPFAELISFVDPLLEDDAYYVQKGVGWTLREIHNVYPVETEDFLQEHATAIDPLAWSAATEKLGKDLKRTLNAARKAHRIRQSKQSYDE